MKGILQKLALVGITSLCIWANGWSIVTYNMGTGIHRSSFVILADIHGEAGKLWDAVNWINANQHNEKIRFVMVLGDITGAGNPSLLSDMKNILDNLVPPYFPLIGNHELMQFATEEYFNTLFESTIIVKIKAWAYDVRDKKWGK